MRTLVRIVSLFVILSLLTGCAFFESILDTIGLAPDGSKDKETFQSPYDKPEVFCAYFHYFNSDTMDQWWYPGRDPSKVSGPEAWRRDIWVGRSGDYPYIGIYNNITDAEVMRWHIRLAKASGITAFLVYMYNWEEQQQETQLMLDVAAQEQFKIGFVEHHSYLGAISRSIFEGRSYPIMPQKYVGYDQIMADYALKTGTSLPEEQTRYIKPVPRSLRAIPADTLQEASRRITGMLGRWKNHSAYLRVDKKPVIFIPYIDADLEHGDLKQLVDAIESEGGEDLYIVGIIPQIYWYFFPAHVPNSGITAEWAKSGVDGFTNWTPNGMVTASQKLRVDVAKFNVKDSVKWHKDPIIPIMPGFNDDAWRPGDEPAPSSSRRNGMAWREQLDAAVAAKPRFLFIQAWNEWHEGSQIEPSTHYSDPYLYLKILAQAMGKPWQTPPLPPQSSVDSLRVDYLPYN